MIVHFVCVGNTYRSRLAEAYFASLDVPMWQAASSGVSAEKNLNGPICWYAIEILKENKIGQSVLEKGWTQTTRENLEKSDRAVFMHRECLDLCRQNIGFVPEHYDVWDIEDMEAIAKNEEAFRQAMEKARETFQQIRKHIDSLVDTLR
jgi:protein-tyrosine-phosphatase